MTPSRSIFRVFITWVLRWRLAVIIFVGVVSLILGWSLPRLKFGTSIYDLIIEDIPENTHYRAFMSEFGSDEIIRIVVRGDNVFDPETFRLIEKLAEDAERIPGVRRVISLPGIKKTVEKTGPISLAEFRAIVSPAALFEKNMISENHRSTIITLMLENETSRTSVIEAVSSLMAAVPKKLTLYQIGMPLVSEALADYTAADFKRLPPVTLVIIAGLLIILFRFDMFLILPILVVVLAQVWTFGLMAWLKIPLSMLTMIVPVLVIAVGTAYCLYLVADYRACALRTESSNEAVFQTFSNLAFPTILAVATTCMGIGSLGISQIAAIREFAMFACIGILTLLFLLFTFFPAALSLFPWTGHRREQGSTVDRFLDIFLEKIVVLNIKHQKRCLTILIVLMIFFALGIFRIRVETNPVEYFKKDTAVSRHFHDIYRDLSGSFPLNVVLTGNTEYYFEDLARIRNMERLQSYMETLPGVDKTISFVDYLKLVNYTLNRYDPKYYTLPEEAFELSMLINNFKIILGDDLLAHFMNPDFSRANIMLFTHLSSSRDFFDTRKKILAHAGAGSESDLKTEVTGLGIVLAASSYHLTSGQVKSLSLALILVFGIMVVLFLSNKVGFIAVLPNLVPIVTNFGIMGWCGVKLSVATSLIASIAIGLAVDDTIHYMFRYNNEFKKDLDKDRALEETLTSVGKPIIFTSLTISLGFSVLIFSHFKPTALFGLMMMITMTSALAGTLFLLPSLMLHVELVTAWDLLKLIPALGGIPPGAAHEIRQPLNAIKVGSEYLKMMIRQGRTISDEQLSRVVNEISVQVNRASIIIDRLLEFGRKSDTAYETIDMNRPVRTVLQLVESEMKLENILLRVELGDDLPPIRANTNHLSQVIYNLLNNSREAVCEKISGGRNPEERRIIVRTIAEEEHVVAEIRDNGIGIPSHLLDRIFEPFFSTKGSGRGLGLSISRQIIKSYGGHFEVDSTEGEGTSVRAVFPAVSR